MSLLAMVGRLKARIAREIRDTRLHAADEAHLATRGDRPFMGCNPCVPSAVNTPAQTRPNPKAKPQPRSRP